MVPSSVAVMQVLDAVESPLLPLPQHKGHGGGETNY